MNYVLACMSDACVCVCLCARIVDVCTLMSLSASGSTSFICVGFMVDLRGHRCIGTCGGVHMYLCENMDSHLHVYNRYACVYARARLYMYAKARNKIYNNKEHIENLNNNKTINYIYIYIYTHTYIYIYKHIHMYASARVAQEEGSTTSAP